MSGVFSRALSKQLDIPGLLPDISTQGLAGSLSNTLSTFTPPVGIGNRRGQTFSPPVGTLPRSFGAPPIGGSRRASLGPPAANFPRQRGAPLSSNPVDQYLGGGAINPIQLMQSRLAQEQTASSGEDGNDSVAPGDSSQAQGIEGIHQYDSIMHQVGAEAGIPWQVLGAIMGIESGGQNLAPNADGAVGVMQVVPHYWQNTANQFGGDLTNPYTNIRTAAEILKMNYQKYGSWEKAAAAYFGGDGAFNADGSYSDHSDSGGTNISQYVNAFRNNMTALGYGTQTPAEQAGGGQAATQSAGNALATALQEQGTPYVWGGADENGFDCSGLTSWAYGKTGKQIGRTADEQFHNTQRIQNADVRPGDLVFFDWDGDGHIDHVGFYAGNNQLLHAPKENDIVKFTDLGDTYYAQHIVGYGRVT